MSKLRAIILERIKRQGQITFKDFMTAVLYYPNLGYYNSERLPIGKAGDFYTSTFLHPGFGAVIAKVLIEMWLNMGSPSDFYVVEIGAGTGYLCKDIFDYLYHHQRNKAGDFLRSMRYVIVEFNAHMAKRQMGLLGGYTNRIKWVKDIKEVGAGLEGCILSNELLDSFPVHLVEMNNELKEIYVDIDRDNFVEKKQRISTDELIKYLNEFNIQLSTGYRTEINLLIKDWLKDVSHLLKRGFVLTIDYGYSSDEYYNEERRRGTLLCYHKHRVHEDPFQHIGEQDITAHVNFSSLCRWGNELGLKTVGYCPQGIFLIASGLDEIITEVYGNSPHYQFIVQGIKNLILPQGMGETHKVMVQYKGKESPLLRGFSISNYVNSLY
ncbi:MAG: SAM-dependent methyltransferase [Thermodesulfovibrionia bacterium]